MTETHYKVYTDGLETYYAQHAQSDPSDVNNTTRGDTFSITLKFPKDTSLTIPSGGSTTINTGETSVQSNIVVNGTLTVNGVLVVYESITNNGEINNNGEIIRLENPREALYSYDQHAGSYSILETLSNKRAFSTRLPTNTAYESLVVGIEPATDLQDKNISGVWGLVTNITDGRTRPLTNNTIEIELEILAQYDEYNTIDDVTTDLEV